MLNEFREDGELCAELSPDVRKFNLFQFSTGSDVEKNSRSSFRIHCGLFCIYVGRNIAIFLRFPSIRTFV